MIFFNIATENMTSINELAELLIKMSGLDLKLIYKNQRQGDIKKSYADIFKVKKLLGWSPEVNPENGLKKFFPKFNLFFSCNVNSTFNFIKMCNFYFIIFKPLFYFFR